MRTSNKLQKWNLRTRKPPKHIFPEFIGGGNGQDMKAVVWTVRKRAGDSDDAARAWVRKLIWVRAVLDPGGRGAA